MKTIFQTTIEKLLKTLNGLEAFQFQEHFHVHFDMEYFDRLVIERHREMMSVSHYFEQNDNLVPDRAAARSSLSGMVKPLWIAISTIRLSKNSRSRQNRLYFDSS